MRSNNLIKTLILSVISTVLLSFFALSASAKGTADFSVPRNAVNKGSEFSVDLKFTADDPIGFVTAMLSYNDDVLEFQSSDFISGGGGVLTINAFPDSSSKEMKVTVNFKAKSSGKSKIDLSNCYITSDDGTQIGSPTAYGYITVSGNSSVVDSSENESSSEPDKLGDPNKGYLKSLTVSKGVLKPAFAYDIYDYTVDVDYDVDFLEIYGETANSTDQIWYTGNENLIEGKNVRTVKVTDKQGYNHVYTITINRAKNPYPNEEQEQIDNSSTSVESIQDSSSSSAVPVIVEDDDKGFFDKNKDIITTGLVIVLATLIIAVIVIIIWLKRKRKQ